MWSFDVRAMSFVQFMNLLIVEFVSDNPWYYCLQSSAVI